MNAGQSDSKSSVQHSSFSAPRRRVVLLGASNLTRGISTVVETAWHTWGQPLEVLAALGHGRSYGIDSRVLGRGLPGIVHCGLWEALTSRSDLPTAALLTDVGNDILYGVEVPRIVEWVDTAIGRLQTTEVRICMTGLPIAGIADLGPARFRLFRRLFFPNCRLSLDEARRRAHDLHEALQSLATARKLHFIEQRTEWYGLDPIHIRLRHWQEAWREVLSGWNSDTSAPASQVRGSLARWLYLRTRRPHWRTWLGIEQRREQPTATLRDGTTISFY